MVISPDSKKTIKTLRQQKGWNGSKIVREFPQKQWPLRSVNYLLNKIDATGSCERQEGSGRPRTTRTDENVEIVENFICSQEGDPGTHQTPREIERITGIPRTSVRRIIKHDLRKHNFRRKKVQKLSQVTIERRLARQYISFVAWNIFGNFDVCFSIFLDVSGFWTGFQRIDCGVFILRTRKFLPFPRRWIPRIIEFISRKLWKRPRCRWKIYWLKPSIFRGEK